MVHGPVSASEAKERKRCRMALKEEGKRATGSAARMDPGISSKMRGHPCFISAFLHAHKCKREYLHNLPASACWSQCNNSTRGQTHTLTYTHRQQHVPGDRLRCSGLFPFAFTLCLPAEHAAGFRAAAMRAHMASVTILSSSAFVSPQFFFDAERRGNKCLGGHKAHGPGDRLRRKGVR